MFKILVVEDDRDLNRTVCAFLTNSGYSAIGCLNANDAYDALYENMFDLIVSVHWLLFCKWLTVLMVAW